MVWKMYSCNRNIMCGDDIMSDMEKTNETKPGTDESPVST